MEGKDEAMRELALSEEFYRELLEDFANDVRNLAMPMQQALERGDRAEFSVALNTLRASAAQIRMHGVAELARQTEKAAHNAPDEDLHARMATLTARLDETLREIAKARN